MRSQKGNKIVSNILRTGVKVSNNSVFFYGSQNPTEWGCHRASNFITSFIFIQCSGGEVRWRVIIRECARRCRRCRSRSVPPPLRKESVSEVSFSRGLDLTSHGSLSTAALYWPLLRLSDFGDLQSQGSDQIFSLINQECDQNNVDWMKVKLKFLKAKYVTR